MENTLQLQKNTYKMFGDLWFGGEIQDPISIGTYDMAESDDEYLISVDLPGISKDHVSISLEDSQLCLRAERVKDHEDKYQEHEFGERFYGSFEKVIPLPSDARGDEISASFSNGVLEIKCPRTGPAKLHSVKIEEGKERPKAA